MATLIEQLTEYKATIDTLSAKAVMADSLTEKLTALEAEHSALITEKETLTTDKEALAKDNGILIVEVASLKETIAKMEEDRKTADAKALEIVGSLGLSQLPVVDVAKIEKVSAEAIRQKYLSIEDSVEKGRFFAENRNAIVNGYLE
jgi:uncharacterized phage infection (PIP) family protein YhgE